VRWERLFDDLEAQLEAAERDEFDAEVADRVRREAARLALLDRLRAGLGAALTVTVHGAGSLSGTLARTGPGWLLLDVAAQPATLVILDAVVDVRGLPAGAREPASMGAVEARLDVGFVLRAIARDRSPVAIVARDGSRFHGTIDRVGADHLDLAEHPAGEPRRAGDVSGVRVLPFAGMAIVRAG
jgi:hypothetical protein